MAVVIGVKREFEFTGNDLNGDGCLFPRSPANHVFVQAFNFSTLRIAADPQRYLAFPFVTKIGSSLIGLYSDGQSHAASDKQIMIRSDDNGVTWSSVEFYVAATGVFNYSLLTGLLGSGQTVVLKSWTVKNTAGVFAATTNSTVIYGGLTYGMWSRAVAGAGGQLWRTGYAANGANVQSALFSSADGGLTWVGRSVMFAAVGRLYSEADLVSTGGTNWMAICREDSGANNPLYKVTSADNGLTWTAPVLLATADINGRQPNLTKMSDGSIILATGDRSGSSGYGGSAGDAVFGFDTTGITVFRSIDNGVTWSFRTRIAATFSTDGGQPMVTETTAGRICTVFYHRTGTKEQPVIASASLDVANL